MFEKEAEIYALSNFGFRGKNSQRVLTAKIDYQEGAEFSYNKVKKQAESIIERLVENKPDTYSGTDVVTNQKKMFAFSKAVNDAIDYLKESR